jgi:hypothetical protein
VVPPAFAAIAASECAITGAHVFLTIAAFSPAGIPAEAVGEGDFAVCPVVSHQPTTFWTVEQVLVFTLSYKA